MGTADALGTTASRQGRADVVGTADALGAPALPDALSTGPSWDALSVATGGDVLAVPAGSDALAVAAGPDPLAVGHSGGALVAPDPIGLDVITSYDDATLSGGRSIAPPVPADPNDPTPRPEPLPQPGRPDLDRGRQQARQRDQQRARSQTQPGRPGGGRAGQQGARRGQPAQAISWNDLTIRGRATTPPRTRADGRPIPDWAHRGGGVPTPTPGPLPAPGQMPGWRGNRSGVLPPPSAPPSRPVAGGDPGGWDSYYAAGGRPSRPQNPASSWDQVVDPSTARVIRTILRFLGR